MREAHFKSEAVRAQYKAYDVRAMAAMPLDNERFRAGWELQLRNLESIYALAAQRDIPVVLLILPYTFQFFQDELNHPQRILAQHAQSLGVPHIDFIDYFENSLETDRINFSINYDDEYDDGGERMDFYAVQKDKFFLDADHFTPIGHRAVAVRLAEFLDWQGLLEVDRPALSADWLEINLRADVFTIQTPHDFKSARRVAHFLKIRGDYQAMEQLYQRVVTKFQDKMTRAYFLLILGDIYAGQEQYAKAVETYGKGIDLAPNLIDLHSSLAAALQQLGDQDGAVHALVRAVEMGANDAETYMALASLLADAGREKKALDTYELLLERDPPNATAEQYVVAGIKLHNRLRSVEKAYYKALEIDPQHMVARVNLGWCLVLQGKFDEAIRENLLVLKEHANSIAHFNLGLIYLLQGRTTEADSAYSAGVRRFGAEEARRIGAVDDLRNLVAQNNRAREAQRILARYWP